MINYTTIVETDAQDNYINTIPEEILNYLNWKEGDTLNWQISDSKQIIITKVRDAEEKTGGLLSDWNVALTLLIKLCFQFVGNNLLLLDINLGDICIFKNLNTFCITKNIL